jgi:hypothetical protein
LAVQTAIRLNVANPYSKSLADCLKNILFFSGSADEDAPLIGFTEQ